MRPFAFLRSLLVVAFLLPGLLGLGVGSTLAQGTGRAEPVTGPGVTTIGGISGVQRVNVRSGPAVLFPIVGTLGAGTRVNRGVCVGGGSARWCEVTTMDGSISGFVAGRYIVEGASPTPDDDLAGGPDFWVVRGLGGNERLGVRLEPRAGAPVLATLQNNEIVRNLGCRLNGQTRWCRIRSTTGMDVTGWVSGSYLRESAAPPTTPRPPAGGNDAGPDFYVVRGLSAGDLLNVRSEPSTQGTVVGRLAEGTRVRALSCRVTGQSRWCQIRTTGGVELTGWVNGRFLRED